MNLQLGFETADGLHNVEGSVVRFGFIRVSGLGFRVQGLGFRV